MRRVREREREIDLVHFGVVFEKPFQVKEEADRLEGGKKG